MYEDVGWVLEFDVVINLVKRPCGSVVEHSLGKGEVAGPIPAMGTSDNTQNGAPFLT
jgi:hypothetical protein